MISCGTINRFSSLEVIKVYHQHYAIFLLFNIKY